MIQLNRIVGIILVLIIAFVVQIFFSIVDATDSPNKAVVEFSKAYFSLDPSMEKRICKKQLAIEDVDIVDEYLYFVAKTAKERGFDVNFLRNKLYHIRTETISKDDTQAQIRITGKIRVAINSLYTVVATIFDIGSTHEVDEIIHVIKEDGQWKVCGNLFSLTSSEIQL